MANVQESLETAMAIDGALGVALVDFESRMCVGSKGGNTIDMELAGAAVTEIIRAKRGLLDNLGLDETIEEIITTLGGEYHLMQASARHSDLFSYLVLEKARSSLPLARTQLRSIDRELVLEDRHEKGGGSKIGSF